MLLIRLTFDHYGCTAETAATTSAAATAAATTSAAASATSIERFIFHFQAAFSSKTFQDAHMSVINQMSVIK